MEDPDTACPPMVLEVVEASRAVRVTVTCRGLWSLRHEFSRLELERSRREPSASPIRRALLFAAYEWECYRDDPRAKDAAKFLRRLLG